MNMQPVSSSRIRSVAWVPNTLHVQFHNGTLYEYDDVTWSEYTNFINSPSLGSALSVIDKSHTYRKI